MTYKTIQRYEEIINKHCTLDHVFNRLEVKKDRIYGTDNCRFKIGESEWQEMPLARDDDGDLKIPSDYDILKHISDDFNFLMCRKMTAWDFVWEYYTEDEMENLIEELGYEL